MQHPVTTSYGQGLAQITETLLAVNYFAEIQKIVLWPNIDAGTDDVSKGIRMFRERHQQDNMHYYRNFSPEDYARVLKNCVCAVGNSSSFIREGTFLGTPAVIVGDRQEGRQHGNNVMFAAYDRNDIRAKIEQQLRCGRYSSNTMFGRGDAGKQIANKLVEVKLGGKKRIIY
jgi:UDP-N-acetylglucosamine 2-epimerase